MQTKKDIIPWKCHICGREFGTISGGICKECGKATCNVCFNLGKLKRMSKLKMPEARVCRTCANKKETKISETWGKAYFKGYAKK
jgi:hypothetical protein